MAIGRPKREVPKPTRIQRRPKDLRDEFAMTVLDRIAADTMTDHNSGAKLSINGEPSSPAEFISWVCYQMADAMMAEREKNNEAD